MRIATIDWRDSTSAALVLPTGLAPVRELSTRPQAFDEMEARGETPWQVWQPPQGGRAGNA